MRFGWVLAAVLGLIAATPLAAQAPTPATTAADPARGGWGKIQRPIDQQAVDRSRASMRSSGGLFGVDNLPLLFVPVGLIFIIARLTLAHLLRKSGPKFETTGEYHEPPVMKWRPLDARAEARLRILEPDYLPPPEQAPPPHPALPPRRGFGRRGL